MSKLRRNEKVVTLGAFALGLAATLGILIAPLAFAQEPAFTPAAQLSHTISIQPNVTKSPYMFL